MRQYTGVNAAIIEDPLIRDIISRIDFFLQDVSRAFSNIEGGGNPSAGGILGLAAGDLKTETTVGVNETAGNLGHTVTFPTPTPGALYGYTFPPDTGTIALLERAQTWAGVQTFTTVFMTGALTQQSGVWTLLDALVNIANDSDLTKTFRWSAAGLASGGGIKTFTLPNFTSTVGVVGNIATPGSGQLGALTKTGQTGNLAATNLANAPAAGNYRVGIYAVTRAVLGGALTITLAWTDPEQAQSKALTLATPDGSYIDTASTINVASGSVTVAVSGYVSGTYDLWARIEPLN